MTPNARTRMQYIADAHVLAPVLIAGHVHQAAATEWWEHCDDGTVGLCLPVRMALLRLLTNVRVMGSSALRPEQAWDVVGQLGGDPRIVVIDQTPQTHARHWQGHIENRAPTPNLWTDAWLAALAQSADCEMVTFDRGFRSFAGLRLRLLAAA